MAGKQASFSKHNTANHDVAMLQDQLVRVFSQILPNALLYGVFLTGVKLSTSDAIVAHGLGNPYQGYLVTDRNANYSVYTSATANPFPDRNIILKAGGTVTVSLYVF